MDPSFQICARCGSSPSDRERQLEQELQDLRAELRAQRQLQHQDQTLHPPSTLRPSSTGPPQTSRRHDVHQQDKTQRSPFIHHAWPAEPSRASNGMLSSNTEFPSIHHPAKQPQVFILEHPKLDRPSGDDWKKTTEAATLLDLSPKTEEEWLTRRKSVLLSEPEAIVRTFFQLIDCTQLQPTPSDARIGQQITTEYDLLRTYQKFALSLKCSSAQLQQLSRFSALLHVCLCRVARKTNKISGDDADQFMNDILSTQTGKTIRSPSHLRHIRSSVRWPIRQARKLRQEGFGNRADELFLLCKVRLLFLCYG